MKIASDMCTVTKKYTQKKKYQMINDHQIKKKKITLKLNVKIQF